MQLVEAFVSQLLGRPVLVADNGSGQRIGKVADLAISPAEGGYPPVTGILVRSTDGVLRYAPFATVSSIAEDAIVLNRQPLDSVHSQLPADQLLLNRDLQDKQIVDVDGKKVVRVNDLKLAPAGDALRLVAVDVGLSGILRRVGFTGLGRRWLDRASRIPEARTLIAWGSVQPLAHDAAEPLRLRVPQDRLERIHPSDLAAIIEELNVPDRASLVESLDEKVAAEAFEQLPEQTQISILEDLEPERAADIVERMDPDDAADLLGEVDPETQADLLRRMAPAEADDVRELLRHSEETAGGLMTTDFLSLPPGLSVADAFEHIRTAADDAELVYYVYVLDERSHIHGVLSLREMLRAKPETLVKDVMLEDVVTVPTTASQEEVATTIARYDLMAVPVVDESGSMRGIVTVDDAVDILLPDKLRKMLPRVGRSRSSHHAARVDSRTAAAVESDKTKAPR